MVWRDVEHLEPSQGVVGQRGHALRVYPLCCQSVRVAHFRPQLGACQCKSLSFQRVQTGMEGSKGMRSCRWGNSQCTVPGEMLHGVSSWVQSIQLRGLHLEARLHPLPQLPLPDLPLPDLPLSQLSLPDGGIHVVEPGHVVGQQGVGGVEGHEEGVVAVGGGHDVGPGVLAQCP